VSAAFDRARIDARLVETTLGRHRIAVVLGTGWSDAVTELTGGSSSPKVRFCDIAGFTAPQVPGHAGTLQSVPVAGRDVLVVAGRTHLYEGSSPDAVVHAVRVAVLAGAEVVVITNAAGSLRHEIGPGHVVAISDQINLTGCSPLTGWDPADESATIPPAPSGFVDLTDLYTADRRAALQRRVPDLPEGVYAGVRGPQFETPAEIRALRTVGADLVGMSTVLEGIAAAHAGAEVVGLSLVTNLAAGLTRSIDHDSILEVGAQSTERLAEALEAVILDG